MTQVGKTVTHYQISSKLGAGGMGEVYLATDTVLNRNVALKFLPESLSADPEARQRLLREAQAASKLNHPNITTVYAVERSTDRDFIVMEYVEGVPLDEFVRSKTWSLERVLDLAIQIGEGLDKAHRAGIVHRDLKPANILVDGDGRPKILDFGLAKFRGAVKLTQTGSTTGTAAYMSPEQTQGRETDSRSDLFSFGVVLYEMIAGRPPFAGEHHAAISFAIVMETPEPLARFKSDVPAELQQIVSKCLAKRPEERYQTAGDLLADLRRLRHTSGSQAAAPVEPRHRMIAVLPFENLGQADDEYFADGITEEIISRLANVDEIGVISRTSAMQYKGTRKSIREIGGELGVDFVLEGTVRWNRSAQGASRVRITPQLIRVNEDRHMWSDRYDRVIEDIFDVQSEIAEQVIAQLNVKLADPQRRAIEAKPTDNIEAYHAYLRGLEYISKPDYSPENHGLAIQMFERASALDPEFAQAHAYLSIAHSGLYFYGYDHTAARVAKAKAAVERALEIRRNDPETPLAFGFYRYRCQADLEGALIEFTQSVKLQPNQALPLFMVAMIQRRQGRFVESLQGVKDVVKLDPRRSSFVCEAGITAMMMRRYDEAEEFFDRSINLTPDQGNAYTWKAMLYLFGRGELSKARACLEMLGDRGHEDAFWEWYELLLAERDCGAALNHVALLKSDIYEDQNWYFPKALLIAKTHTLLGDPTRALPEYASACTLLEAAITADPEDPRKHAALALAYAGLRKFEDAFHHARAAVDAPQVVKDSLSRPLFVATQIEVHVSAGDHATALRLIDEQLSIPSWLAPAWLRTLPYWDSLRSNPEFQKLLQRPLKTF
ncbi:MAG: protein kinase [candidate division Zixibacteria bacterium]|nr:protein kinase [candidate division Zixibacteria bacterium]